MPKPVPSIMPIRTLTQEKADFIRELGTSAQDDVGTTAQAPKSPSRQKPKSPTRRVAVYFPVALAKKLRVHCAQHDRDMSGFVTEAVEAALSRRSG